MPDAEEILDRRAREDERRVTFARGAMVAIAEAILDGERVLVKRYGDPLKDI